MSQTRFEKQHMTRVEYYLKRHQEKNKVLFADLELCEKERVRLIAENQLLRDNLKEVMHINLQCIATTFKALEYSGKVRRELLEQKEKREL